MTLTDIATGWTECLPILYKSSEAVLSAFQQARVLFPFPILGLDTDSGGEFISAPLKRYCKAERITFTRGRERCKADQCFVEQKNGAIVRHFVGFERLVGEQAYLQIRELYRAVRLYVNCFQPSMKLLDKYQEGEQVRRVYDAAKTPWQRLMLSGVLPATTQQHLDEVVQALDPLRQLSHLEQLQQALWRCAVPTSPLTYSAPAEAILPFCVQGCMQGPLPLEEKTLEHVLALRRLQGEAPGGTGLLDWARTSHNPFEGQWELILSLVLTYPEWSGNDLFGHLQHLFPGRYRPSQASTLRIGLRKIRARLLTLMQEPWPQEVIQGNMSTTVSAGSDQPKQEAGRKIEASQVPSASLSVLAPQEYGIRRPVHPESVAEEAITHAAERALSAAQRDGDPPTMSETSHSTHSNHLLLRLASCDLSRLTPQHSRLRVPSGPTCRSREQAGDGPKRWSGIRRLWVCSNSIWWASGTSPCCARSPRARYKAG